MLIYHFMNLIHRNKPFYMFTCSLNEKAGYTQIVNCL